MFLEPSKPTLVKFHIFDFWTSFDLGSIQFDFIYELSVQDFRERMFELEREISNPDDFGLRPGSAILSQIRVEATRVSREDFAKANNLVTYSSVYEKAKFTMSCWFERLASGPSPRGPGH
ncbi:hypothetical protein DITRI_Ditri17bG0014500 [Diplodiscus trichospermus]